MVVQYMLSRTPLHALSTQAVPAVQPVRSFVNNADGAVMTCFYTWDEPIPLHSCEMLRCYINSGREIFVADLIEKGLNFASQTR